MSDVDDMIAVIQEKVESGEFVAVGLVLLTESDIHALHAFPPGEPRPELIDGLADLIKLVNEKCSSSRATLRSSTPHH